MADVGQSDTAGYRDPQDCAAHTQIMKAAPAPKELVLVEVIDAVRQWLTHTCEGPQRRYSGEKHSAPMRLAERVTYIVVTNFVSRCF